MSGRGDADGLDPPLRIWLFGDLEIERDGETRLALESGRAAALIAYLLLHRDRAQSRQRVAYMLWPNSTEPQARTNLRHVLHNLRRAFPEADRYLHITQRTLQWHAADGVWLDVAAFEAKLEQAGHASEDAVRIADLREAVGYYRGDLVEGCYDSWIEGERERLRARFLDALERLAELLAKHGEHAEAIQHAERLLRHDPLAESAYRLLMRLHDARGDRPRALRVYHACAATLERELGAEPSPETREHYAALLATDEADEGVGARRTAGPPLIGRSAERAKLTETWRTVQAGRSRFVLITGEAGIGKTRLVEEFRDWCAHHGAITAQAASYRAEGTLAYGLIVSWLRSPVMRKRLRRVPAAQLTELARLLPEILVERPDLAHPQPLPENDQRQRLFHAVSGVVHSSTASLVLIADDLQWCDPESLRLMHYLLRIRPAARLLIAATARLEDLDGDGPVKDLVSALAMSDNLLEIPLPRLSSEETATLAARLANRKLDAVEQGRLYEETEGNPLFIVEAVRAGWSHGTPQHTRLSPRVQAAIESRLTQLSPQAVELAEVAATIGRDFTSDVLADAAGVPPDMLVANLDELWRRRIVREHGADGYDFSHDKLREVVYDGLSPARRRHLHLRVAHALVRKHATDPGSVSAQLALHFERAGAVSEAIDWSLRAADAAQVLYAQSEALRLLDHAVELVHRLPHSVERDKRELEILTAIAAPLAMTESFGSPRLPQVLRRAIEVARSLGIEPPAPLLRSLAVASLSNGDFAAARKLGGRLRAAGSRDGDDVLLVEAEYVLGIAEFWQGRFAAARTHFETAVARYRPAHRASHVLRYGQDPRVVCQSRLASSLAFLGDIKAALDARDRALRWGEESGSETGHATAFVFAAMLALELRDMGALHEYVTALQAWCKSHDAKVIEMTTEALTAYLDVLGGGAQSDGMARIDAALAASSKASPAPGAQALFARILLAACAGVGAVDTGLAAADRMLTMGSVAVWESEARRLRAEFRATQGAPSSEIVGELHNAFAVARRQRAGLFELRAAAAMIRLGVGNPAAARRRLATVVSRLRQSGTVVTPDFVEAAELLDSSPAKRPEERSRNAASATLGSNGYRRPKGA